MGQGRRQGINSNHESEEHKKIYCNSTSNILNAKSYSAYKFATKL